MLGASMPLEEQRVDSKVKTGNAAQRGRRGCDDGDVDNDAQEEVEDGAQGRRVRTEDAPNIWDARRERIWLIVFMKRSAGQTMRVRKRRR